MTKEKRNKRPDKVTKLYHPNYDEREKKQAPVKVTKLDHPNYDEREKKQATSQCD